MPKTIMLSFSFVFSASTVSSFFAREIAPTTYSNGCDGDSIVRLLCFLHHALVSTCRLPLDALAFSTANGREVLTSERGKQSESLRGKSRRSDKKPSAPHGLMKRKHINLK
jgi:hypothetical protein